MAVKVQSKNLQQESITVQEPNTKIFHSWLTWGVPKSWVAITPGKAVSNLHRGSGKEVYKSIYRKAKNLTD